MKLKVSDYIVEFFNKNGINTLFTITGGFAMHLNDSFGNHPNYKIYYQFLYYLRLSHLLYMYLLKYLSLLELLNYLLLHFELWRCY
jgi:hypothetical protein